MAVSAFDLFKVGIGPSSSHTVGPMRAAGLFVRSLEADGTLERTARVHVELFGSLGATGHGHGSVKAVVLGLHGDQPDTVDPAIAPPLLDDVRSSGGLDLLGRHRVTLDLDDDVVMHRKRRLPFHTNAMTFEALDGDGARLDLRTYYSVGGGFVLDESEAGTGAGDRAASTDDHPVDGPPEPALVPDRTPLPYRFASADELLGICEREGLSVSQVMMANERAWRSEEEVRAGLLHVWSVMRECVERGSTTEGVLPGGLKVRRRAADLRRRLEDPAARTDPLDAMEWVGLWALAVNEENAAGGRVVTAPTNGAAGILPAVMHHWWYTCAPADGLDDAARDDGIVRFLLAATAVGLLFKENASISGAEVGCQGEVGSACSMAAAGLAEVLGGTPRQVENAAEIGIEHNLGLTCDPVGGLVQIPCIERNAVASVKAIVAARMAVRGDGTHHVSLDKAITTMRQTGADMKDKYKETARGGLALNVVEC